MLRNIRFSAKFRTRIMEKKIELSEIQMIIEKEFVKKQIQVKFLPSLAHSCWQLTNLFQEVTEPKKMD